MYANYRRYFSKYTFSKRLKRKSHNRSKWNIGAESIKNIRWRLSFLLFFFNSDARQENTWNLKSFQVRKICSYHLLFAGILRTHHSHSIKLGVPWVFGHVFISLWNGLRLTELRAELFRKLERFIMGWSWQHWVTWDHLLRAESKSGSAEQGGMDIRSSDVSTVLLLYLLVDFNPNHPFSGLHISA